MICSKFATMRCILVMIAAGLLFVAACARCDKEMPLRLQGVFFSPTFYAPGDSIELREYPPNGNPLDAIAQNKTLITNNAVGLSASVIIRSDLNYRILVKKNSKVFVITELSLKVASKCKEETRIESFKINGNSISADRILINE